MLIEQPIDSGGFSPQRNFACLPTAAPCGVVPWLRFAWASILEPPWPFRGHRDTNSPPAASGRQRSDLAGQRAVFARCNRTALGKVERDHRTAKCRTHPVGLQGSSGVLVHDALETPATQYKGFANLPSLYRFDLLVGSTPIDGAVVESSRSPAHV